MATKITLNRKNFEALGAARLAELLVEISSGNATAKRRLRLELAGAQSTSELAKEVRKRIDAIARSHSFVDWQGIRALAEDLEIQRQAIEKIGKKHPQDALDLLWRFMALASPTFERCDDSSGRVISVFRQACSDMGDVAVKAKTDPVKLANQVFAALKANDYGQFDGLIGVLAPALGKSGLEHLKGRVIEFSNTPVQRPAEQDRVTIGWSSSGPIYEDEMAQRSRVSRTRLALMDIADASGDVDGFIEQYDDRARTVPKIAAEIAQRLLSAGRVAEAWRAIEAAEHRGRSGSWAWPDFAWEDARIEVLEALGRGPEAQLARWGCFERSLSSRHLRAYLTRLPDFEDVEAEKRALQHAQSSRDLLQALSFLISWPALERAATIVLQRADELDGDHYELLGTAADRLAEKYPLAATAILRSMIDFSLKNGRSSRYQHAARHLLECSALASAINDFRNLESHDAYEARLRREHARKSSFWALVA